MTLLPLSWRVVSRSCSRGPYRLLKTDPYAHSFTPFLQLTSTLSHLLLHFEYLHSTHATHPCTADISDFHTPSKSAAWTPSSPHALSQFVKDITSVIAFKHAITAVPLQLWLVYFFPQPGFVDRYGERAFSVIVPHWFQQQNLHRAVMAMIKPWKCLSVICYNIL